MAIIYGNFANNFIPGTAAADTIYGGGGDDTITDDAGPNSSADVLWGDDSSSTSIGNDSLFSYGGGDTLRGGWGNDVLIFTDTYTYASGSPVKVADGDPQFGSSAISGDTIAGYFSSDINFSGFGRSGDDFMAVYVAPIGNNNAVVTLNGGTGNDTIAGIGTFGWGYAGLISYGVFDVIGGAGADYLIGGYGFGGSHTFIYNKTDEGGDTIFNFSNDSDLIAIRSIGFAPVPLPPGTLSAALFVTGTAFTNTTQRFLFNPTTNQLIFDSNGSAAGGVISVVATFTGVTDTTITNEDIVVF